MPIITPTSSDLIALSALATHCFSETFGHLYSSKDLMEFVTKHYDPDVLAIECARADHTWRMIVDDTGVAMAYLELCPVGLPHEEARPETQGEIKRLYVHSDFQGRGLGKQLMDIALETLETRFGNAPQWIGVWSENTRAIGLYESYGFHKIGEYGFVVGETVDHEFILRRKP